MLEIIAMIYLGRRISFIVTEKGLKPAGFIILMIVLWIGFEIVGAVLGNLLIGPGLASYPIALLGAALGAFISYMIAANATSQRTGDINL